MFDHILPRPRSIRVDDGAALIPTALDTVIAGDRAGSEAWRLLAEERPDALPPEGYVLRIEARDAAGGVPGARAVIAAADARGVFRARAVLRQLADSDGIHPVTIADWPELARRGVVEGFYGPPWSHDERIDFLRFAGRVGFNEYVYAPKDDPYHRERWRDPYPAAELAEIAELVAEAERNEIDFVYAVSPALSMRFSDDTEHEALAAKAEQLWSVGVRFFALLFDDVPSELGHPEDIATFGTDAEASGIAHGTACARFSDGFLRDHDIDAALVMCPTDYAGCASSAYRRGLQQTLPPDVLVMWTGSDIVVGEVTRQDIDEAAASYGRRLVLWDNFPVNDFDRSRLFLGPLLGRTTDLAGSALVGISSNPMVEAAPSHLALATVADWAWNPGAYDPADASRRAIAAVAGDHADEVAALVEVSGSWPPSAPQSTKIAALVTATLDGDPDALAGLETALTLLSRVGERIALTGQSEQPPLTAAIEPWLAAARDAGRAGALACALLRHLGDEHEQALAAEREAVLEAQRAAEAHYPNVLRSVLPDFVRQVLVRAGVGGISVAAHRRVSVLIGENPVPGDRDLSERLTARGFDVDLVNARDGFRVSDATDLVIVTAATSAAAATAAAAAEVPVLAWGRFDTMGLTTDSGVLLAQEAILIERPEHPLAAGANGQVRVYRGPGKLSWGQTGPEATVVARSAENAQPVIAHYPTGSTLPDGSRAPADRVLFFLSGDGLAPWLIAPEGYDLWTAAVDLLSAGDGGGSAIEPAPQHSAAGG